MSNNREKASFTKTVLMSVVIVVLGGIFLSLINLAPNRSTTISANSVASTTPNSGIEAYPMPTSTVVNLTPSAPPPKPSDPWQVAVFAEPNTQNVKELTEMSTAVIRGTIEDILPARWSTADGKRPDNPFDRSKSEYIYTPIIIRTTTTFKGQATAMITMTVGIGAIGNDSLTRHPIEVYSFSKGQDILVFLSESYDASVGTVLDFYDKYVITDDSEASDFYRTLPLSEIIKDIELASNNNQ